MADRNTPKSPRTTAASRRASREKREAERAEARAIEEEENALEDEEDALEDEIEALEDEEDALEDEQDALEDEEDALKTEQEKSPRKRRKAKRGAKRRPRGGDKGIERDFYRLLKLCKGMNGDSHEITDAISTSLLATMGSVPSYSIGETMISASQAQGQMLVNSVANQQRTNIVGMVATVSSVAQLLDMRPDRLWREVEDEEDDLL